MSFDPLKLENQLCFPLYACAKEVVRRYKPLLDPLGLTYTQYIALMVLWEHGDITVKALGERLYLDSGTLTPLLKKLEQDGLVTRNRCAHDERQLLVSLSEKGRALRQDALDVPERLSACIPLSTEDAQTLYRLLYQVLGQL